MVLDSSSMSSLHLLQPTFLLTFQAPFGAVLPVYSCHVKNCFPQTVLNVTPTNLIYLSFYLGEFYIYNGL